MKKMPDYVPEFPDFKMDIAAFWSIPDATRPSGHRLEPIPPDQFAAYLNSLSDEE